MRDVRASAVAVCLIAVVAAVLILGVLVLGDDRGPGPHAMVAGAGLHVRVPPEWNGRVRRDPGGLALARISGSGVTIDLAEVGNRPGTNGFRVVDRPLLTTRRFAMADRSFVLSVDFAANPPPGNLVRAASDVLGTLRVRPPVPPGTWAALRRPLDLAALRPGERCHPAPAGRASRAVGVTLGAGPAYPVLGSPGGVAALADDIQREGRYAHKTLWAISPRYRGPVLIRGRRLDGRKAKALHFGLLSRPQPELRLPPGAGWRYAPSTTLLPGPGCYAFRVDGHGFRQRIVFTAR
jgi:hypothetical protein